MAQARLAGYLPDANNATPTDSSGRADTPPWPFAPYEKRRAPIGDAAFFIGNGEAQ